MINKGCPMKTKLQYLIAVCHAAPHWIALRAANGGEALIWIHGVGSLLGPRAAVTKLIEHITEIMIDSKEDPTAELDRTWLRVCCAEASLRVVDVPAMMSEMTASEVADRPDLPEWLRRQIAGEPSREEPIVEGRGYDLELLDSIW